MKYPLVYLLILSSVNFFASEPLNKVTVRNPSKHDFTVYYRFPSGDYYYTELLSKEKLTIYNACKLVLENKKKPQQRKAIDIGYTPPLTITIQSAAMITLEQEGARIIPSLEFVSQNSSSSGSSYSAD